MAADPDRVPALQRRIVDALAAMDAAPPGTPQYREAARPVLAATVALLDHEDELPALRDAPRRGASLRAVRRVGTAIVVVAAVLVPVVALGRVPAWWLLLLGPQAVAGLAMLRLPVAAVGGPHLAQRQGAVLAGLAGAVADLAVLGALPVWSVGVVAIGGLTAARMLRPVR